MALPACLTLSDEFQGLKAATVLRREQAERRIRESLSAQNGLVDVLELIKRHCDWLESETWEQRLGYLSALKIAMEHHKDVVFSLSCAKNALRLLMDPEARVRAAMGGCLGAAAANAGPDVWKLAQDPILEVIDYCWDRDALLRDDSRTQDPPEAQGRAPGGFVTDLLRSSYKHRQPGRGEMRHGTEGWQALESSFVAVKMIVEGTGPGFAQFESPQLLDLLFRASKHPNRFVRETSYHTLACICSYADTEALRGFGVEVAACLQDGLSENWSQVRYAACVCARALLQAAAGFEATYFPLILPHLCFNRYDVAEGVRYYSLDTWKLVLKADGPSQVAKHISEVVSYYVRCAKTNNHTVREAACQCMAELFTKIDKTALKPQLPKLQRSLRRSLKDDSWTVRDAASTAYAKAALAFPEDCKLDVDDIYPLWFSLLDDNVYSVREHAAGALCDIIQAYGQPALDRIMPLLRTNLAKAKAQPAEPSISKGQAQAPATAFRRDGSDGGSGHTAQAAPADDPVKRAGTSSDVNLGLEASDKSGEDPLFKEGSLLRARPKDTGGIDYSCGCMDYGFKRPKQPWEASDGAVYLLAGLSEVKPDHVPPFMPLLAEIALLDHWPQARSLQTTIWSQVPRIMKGLGKQVFKRYLEELLLPLFRSLGCENQLCRVAAGKCVAAIRDCIGPGIFAGRLTDAQKAAMDASPDVPPLAGRYAPVAHRAPQVAQWVK